MTTPNDQTDVVGESLALAKTLNVKYPQLYEQYKTQEEFLERAITIHKQQMLVLQELRAYYNDFPSNVERELTALDALMGEGE